MGTQPDLSEFIAHIPRYGRKACRLAAAREQLTEEDAAKLDAACAQEPGVIPAGSIVKWLETRGQPITHQLVATHRFRKCSCYD